LTKEDVRQIMQKRLLEDKTTLDIPDGEPAQLNPNLDPNIPPYTLFTWNTPVIRHTF